MAALTVHSNSRSLYALIAAFTVHAVELQSTDARPEVPRSTDTIRTFPLAPPAPLAIARAPAALLVGVGVAAAGSGTITVTRTCIHKRQGKANGACIALVTKGP